MERQVTVTQSYTTAYPQPSVLEAYSAYELTGNEGERLTVLEEERGWIRCRRSDGEIGWIPEKHAE